MNAEQIREKLHHEFLSQSKNTDLVLWTLSVIEKVLSVFPTADIYSSRLSKRNSCYLIIGSRAKEAKSGHRYFFIKLTNTLARVGLIRRGQLACYRNGGVDDYSVTFKNGNDVSPEQAEAWLKSIQSRMATDNIHLEGHGLFPTDYEKSPIISNTDEDDDEGPDEEDNIKQNDITSISLNQILFGPPGTGKTYNTINKALDILDPDYLAMHSGTDTESRKKIKQRFDALVDEQRIRFTTFHQSFSYEDFVEGLRATNDEESGQLRYEVVDGIFKQISEACKAKVTIKSTERVNLTGRKIWKMSLGNTQGDDAFIYEECIQQGYALLGYGDQINFTECKSRKEIHELFTQEGYNLAQDAYAITAVATFLLKIKPGDLVVVTEGNYKFRAIGEFTSDYECITRTDDLGGYGQCRRVKWLRVYEPALPHEQLMNRIFSQATIYQLHEGSIDTKKLSSLLNEEQLKSNDTEASNFFTRGELIGKYQVLSVSNEVVELLKPNDSRLPLAMTLITELAEYVKNGEITLSDIRDAKVFEKVVNSKLDRYLVNGYNNILPELVKRLITPSKNETKKSLSKPASDARVLIIDEINRGNISRIFGELITLIEPSKRQGADEALEVILPYSKTPFSVPDNLYIIGTMNTADRSLAGLDIALRRRFTFVEMPPKPELLDGIEIDGLNISTLLRVMNQRIEILLDRDHCLGHAYFMSLKDEKTIVKLASIFKNQILPLLQEYFFEDWERINWVLNGHRAKNKSLCFIKQPDGDNQLSQLFGESLLEQLQDRRWQINEEAFDKLESYHQILQGA